MTGNLSKLEIQSYKDATYEEGGKRDKYQVLINPTEYTKSYKVNYEKTQAKGNSSANLKYNSTEPEVLNLDLVFDGTNTIGTDEMGLEAEPVPEQIRRFKKVVIQYHGDTHEPSYVKLTWGTMCFKGRMTNLDLTYTLFRPDGTPLRAKAKATFSGSMDDTFRENQQNAQSPDMSHVRVVKEGDTLPMMTYRIYGDPKYYVQVAQENQLKDFRNLKAGQKVVFPPFEKSLG